MDKNKLFTFLAENDHCVLSTHDGNKSQSALMGYGISENLEFIFGTSNKSRKFNNILKQSNVSIVVGWTEGKTIQYEGSVEFLSGEDLEKYKNIYFTQRPNTKKYESLLGQVYFKVNPNWIRFTDVTKKPWDMFEISKF